MAKKVGTYTRKQNGFTLIEILVAVSVMSLLILGLMRMMQNQGKVSKTFQAQTEITSMVSEVSNMLSNYSGCFNTFFMRPIGVDTVSADIESAGWVDWDGIYTTSQTVPRYQIGDRVGDFTLSGIRVKLLATNIDTANGIANGTVELAFSRIANSQAMGGADIIRRIGFQVYISSLQNSSQNTVCNPPLDSGQCSQLARNNCMNANTSWTDASAYPVSNFEYTCLRLPVTGTYTVWVQDCLRSF